MIRALRASDWKPRASSFRGASAAWSDDSPFHAEERTAVTAQGTTTYLTDDPLLRAAHDALVADLSEQRDRFVADLKEPR